MARTLGCMNPGPSRDPLTDNPPARPRQAGPVLLGVLSFSDLATLALTGGKTQARVMVHQ